MEFLSNKPLLITDTILRDAHQSQAATRMTLEDMLPACEVLDSIGYYSLECWGGATFDSCLRFLNEDPWERLRQLRAHLPHTKLQMLFRGQNILGYKHYADDVVDEFCAKSIENGIDIIRIFDALNDVRNLEQAIKSTKKYGGQVEATLSYTISPIHNEDYFVKLGRELEEMGADALCIKDMANLLLPMDAYSLVKRLKETVSIPIHLHTHNTSGTGDMVYLMAAMAGVDIVDTALSPLANGTSQPATESLVATLKGTVRDTGLDLGKMSEAAVHFRKVAERLKASGALDPKVLNVDTNTLLYQVPGGMLSNLISQLKQAGKEDKYYDVLAEIPRVREDFGYPPLVTPSSQIVGTQAVMNIIFGERYKNFPKESRAMLRGEYVLTQEDLDNWDKIAWESGMAKVQPSSSHRNTDVALVIIAEHMSPEMAKAVRKKKHYQSKKILLQKYIEKRKSYLIAGFIYRSPIREASNYLQYRTFFQNLCRAKCSKQCNKQYIHMLLYVLLGGYLFY